MPAPRDFSRMARALLEPQDREIIDRATMLPIGQYEDGSLTFAWPGFLKDAYEGAVRSFEQGRQLPRADDSGHYAGTPRAEPLDAFNAASVAPGGTLALRAARLTKDVGDLGMFAGRSAKTADHAKLAQAERMAAEGAPRDQIWSDTGWFQGVDGKWRFEIDDSTAAYRPNHRNVQGAFDHPEMHAAYPELGSIKIGGGAPANGGLYTSGRWPGDEGVLSVGWTATPDKATSIGLHEAQHAIQRAEGFARGATQREFTPADIASERSRLSALQDDRGWTSVGVFAGESSDADIARNLYHRSAGEVEARAVQTRQRMTAEQRAERAPWLDYDVPEDNQILRYYANPENAGLPYLMTNGMEGEQRDILQQYGLLGGQDYGDRPDGTPKGDGYFGQLTRPDGGVSTELSAGFDINGRETEVPLLVPSLSGNEINWLLENEPDPRSIPEPIMQKAYNHALQRLSAGKSPFASQDDLRLPPFSVPFQTR